MKRPVVYFGSVESSEPRPEFSIRVRNESLRVIFDLCNQCMRCVKVAPKCIRISPENFHGFFEAMAIAANFCPRRLV